MGIKEGKRREEKQEGERGKGELCTHISFQKSAAMKMYLYNACWHGRSRIFVVGAACSGGVFFKIRLQKLLKVVLPVDIIMMPVESTKLCRVCGSEPDFKMLARN